MADPERQHTAEAQSLEDEVRHLVDDYRSRCLWFLRPDYYPVTAEEILRVLRHIDNNGDRAAFQRAGRIRQSLSGSSNAKSAGS